MASKLQAVAPQLWSYWTHGKGLARWGGSATPYRTLLAELTSESVPPTMVKGLAARIYHAAKGVWPGKSKGRSRADWTGYEHRAAIVPDEDVRCVRCGRIAVESIPSGHSSFELLVCAGHAE